MRKLFIASLVAGVGIGAAALLGCQSQAPAAATPAAKAPAAAAPTAAPAAQPTAAAPAAAPTTAPAAAAPTETLKLGMMVQLTGPLPRMGINNQRFAQMAVEDINAKGGVKVGGKSYRLTLTEADDRFTSEGGRQAADRLVLAEKVKFVLGSFIPDTAGAQAITEPNKVLLMATSASDGSLGPKFPLTLQTGVPTMRMRAAAMYEWLAKAHPQAKRVGVILTEDATGQGYIPLAEANAKERGIELVAKEFHATDLKDFTPIVTRLLRTNPDAIDIGGTGSMAPLFRPLIKALYDQGYRKPVFAWVGDVGSMKDGGATVSNYVAGSVYEYNSPTVSQGEREVMTRYVQKFGANELEPAPATVYNSLLLLAQAIEKAGTVTDAEKVAQVLRDGEWNTTFGKTRLVGEKTFGVRAVIEQPIYISRAVDGKLDTFQSVRGTLP